MTDQPQIPAAWHQDPEDPTQLRYWDGSAWTDHRAPNPAASQPSTPQPSVSQSSVSQASSSSAAAASTEAFAAPTFPTAPTPYQSSYQSPVYSSAPAPYEGDVPPTHGVTTSYGPPSMGGPSSMHGVPSRSGVPAWVWVLIVFGVLSVIGIAVGIAAAVASIDDETASEVQSTPSDGDSASGAPETSPEAEEGSEPGDGGTSGAGEGSFGAGVWVVGEDVAPGTYRVASPVVPVDEFDYCFWSLSTDASGDVETMVASGLAEGGIPTVTLAAGNEFESDGCGDWVAVDPATLFARTDAATSIEPGVWLVGEDIAPGTYSAVDEVVIEDEFDYCYWAIETGIEGSFAEILDNDLLEEGRPTVTLEVGQQFESTGCGSWALAQ